MPSRGDWYRIVKCDDSKLSAYEFSLCGHDHYDDPENDVHRRLKQQLACKYTHIKSGSKDYLTTYTFCREISKCDICNMEFVLDAKVYDDERKRHLTAIFLTRYFNLGPCQTPDDSKWRSHLPVKAFKNPDTNRFPMPMYGGGQPSDDSQWQRHYPAAFVNPSPLETSGIRLRKLEAAFHWRNLQWQMRRRYWQARHRKTENT